MSLSYPWTGLIIRTKLCFNSKTKITSSSLSITSRYSNSSNSSKTRNKMFLRPYKTRTLRICLLSTTATATRLTAGWAYLSPSTWSIHHLAPAMDRSATTQMALGTTAAPITLVGLISHRGTRTSSYLGTGGGLVSTRVRIQTRIRHLMKSYPLRAWSKHLRSFKRPTEWISSKWSRRSLPRKRNRKPQLSATRYP